MQSNISKIIITLIALVIMAGAVLIWWLFASAPKVTTTPTGTQIMQNGQSTDNQSSVTIPTADIKPPVQSQSPADIHTAYTVLFSQILATEVEFTQASATSTGDLANIYALYAVDVAEEKKMYPQNKISTISAALVDLTDDKKTEAIVYEDLPSYCGSGGCTLDVYQKTGTAWKKIFSTVGGGIVGLSNTLTNGHLDLYLTVGAGTTVDRYVWNGSTYQFKEIMATWNGAMFTPLQ